MTLKRISFIRPNMGDFRSSDALPPLSLGILAGLTPAEVEISFFDDKLEEIPPHDTPDLAVFTVETFTARRAYALAACYRARGIPVVMGGYHPTLLPEEAMQHADAIVRGDAESIWETLLSDVERRRLRPLYQGDMECSIETTFVDRRIFQGKRYPPIEPIQFGRGCRFSCDFCSIRAFYQSKMRSRSTNSLVREIASLHPRRAIFFVDDNLFSTPTTLREFLDAIRPLKRRWSCQISIDVAKNESLLDELARAGCFLALVGFESFSEANLRQMGKIWNLSAGGYEGVVKKFHERGIAVYGTFVFGYDNDTPNTVQRVLDFALSSNLDMANFNPLTPTPGTPLYDRLLEAGRLFSPRWWVDPSYRYGDPIFDPAQMTGEDLAAACFEAKKKFYGWGSIARRVIQWEAGFDVFRSGLVGLANIISRREVYRKQSRTLGV